MVVIMKKVPKMTKVNSFSSRAYFLKEHPDRVQKPCQGNFSVPIC